MRLWIQISSGTGPEECCWAAARVAEIVAREAQERNIRWSELQRLPSKQKGNIRSLLAEIDGVEAAQFLKSWVGTILWIGTSPYRPNHKRINWFIAVNSVDAPKIINYAESEFTIETKRGSGPGGQNRNKRDTAVRVRHLGTNLTASSANERSQKQNKRAAINRLKELVTEQNSKSQQQVFSDHRIEHYRLTRGNPIRTFVGAEFKRID